MSRRSKGLILSIIASLLSLLFVTGSSEGREGTIGTFCFRTREVDAGDFPIAFCRVGIPWGAVEPEEGIFSWDAPPLKKINCFLQRGIKVIPVMRTVGAEWTVRHPSWKCSSPPRDLEDRFDERYGYSSSYYRFIKEVIRRYRGAFPIVVIENEVTARGFWCGGMDEYLRLVATARKAIRDVDPQVKVADSGIASLCWGLLMTKALLEEGREEEAFQLYKAYFQEAYVRRATSLSELHRLMRNERVREHIRKGSFLLRRLKEVVDVVNFHYYESPRLFPVLISFIRERTGKEALMNNELGSRYRLGVPQRERRAAEDMVKKLALSVAMGLQAVIWFPFSNDRHHIVGLGDEGRRPIFATLNAFKTSTRFLNRPLLSYRDLSKGRIRHHSFLFPSWKVDVVWSEGKETVEVEGGCSVYDFQGSEVTRKRIRLGPSPAFIVCPR